uniref:Uncharacterized protein n=1 Tax=Leersia perrieri TaxID=77586 RepID=A0A0D9WEV4_9ORYZ
MRELFAFTKADKSRTVEAFPIPRQFQLMQFISPGGAQTARPGFCQLQYWPSSSHHQPPHLSCLYQPPVASPFQNVSDSSVHCLPEHHQKELPHELGGKRHWYPPHCDHQLSCDAE